MKRIEHKHQTVFGTSLILLAMSLLLNRCGLLEYGGECWTEGIIALLGGTVLATEGTVHLTQVTPQTVSPHTFSPLVNPLDFISEANAAISCPILTDTAEWKCIDPTDYQGGFAATGPMLQVQYKSCKFPNRTDQLPGYRYGYQWFKMPSYAICESVRTGGSFTGVSALNGNTITRTFGQGQNGNQHNYRLSQTNEFVAMWTDFPSGWYDNRPMGGIDILFNADGSRTLTIKGFHAKGFVSLTKTKLKDTADGVPWNFLTDGLDLEHIDSLVLNEDYRATWDHTIDTPADATYNPRDNEGVPPTYSTITVTGTGATRKVTSMKKARIQHNIANRHDPRTMGVSYLAKDASGAETPLTWENDPNCCWPTSGTIKTDFLERNGLNPRPDWVSEEVKFTSKCGVVQYKAYLTVDPVTNDPLGDPDITVLHTLSHCF